MSDDPYKVLGLAKSATQDEIKKAYRQLARRLHPDLNPGDAAKQAEFQRVSHAHDLLSDPEKRRRFDSGEIDASGHERAQRSYYRDQAGADPRGRYESGAGYGDFESFSDVFSDLFGSRARRTASHAGDAPGGDLRYNLDVDFMDAARGAIRQLTLPDGNRIDLTIPAGLRDGQTLRLRGKGQPGIGKGPAGDAYVTIGVRPHPVFRRDGNDIEIELPITFDEAVLGAKVDVPTVSGAVTMTVPKGASSGDRLRLKGKGIAPAKGPSGDQHVRLRIVLPDRIDAAMQEIAERWRAQAGFDPRAELRRQT